MINEVMSISQSKCSKSKFTEILDPHTYPHPHPHNSTRYPQPATFSQTRYKTATGQRSFLYRTVTNWNSLPSSIKLSPSINIFKRKLRNYLL